MEFANLMDRSQFWIELSIVSSPALLSRIGQKLTEAAARDPELDITLRAAGMRTVCALWPGCWSLMESPLVNGAHISFAHKAEGDHCWKNSLQRNDFGPDRLVQATQKAMSSIALIKRHDLLPAANCVLDKSEECLHRIATAFENDVMVAHFAAEALASLDSVLRVITGLEALSAAKRAQKDTQDVVLLSCCKSVDALALQKKGLPRIVRDRLCAAYQRDVSEDFGLWSRLCNSKYQLFERGIKRPSKKSKKPTTPDTSLSGDDPQSTTASDDPPARNFVIERPLTPSFGSTEPEREHVGEQRPLSPSLFEYIDADDNVQMPPFCLPFCARERNTFIEVPEVDSRSESEVSRRYAATCPSTSGHKRLSLLGSISLEPAVALAPRAPIHEVLEEIQQECGPLCIEIDDCAIKIMDELLKQLRDMRARSLVCQWVELFKREPEVILSSAHEFRHLLDVVSRVIRLETSEALIRHCCVALGGMAVAMPALAADVCFALNDVLDRFPENLVIQDVCMAKLARKICLVTDFAFGISISVGQAGTLPIEMQQRLLDSISSSLERANQSGFSNFQDDDFRVKGIQSNAFRIFSRMLTLPELLHRCGDDPGLLDVALFEIFQALDISSGPLSEYWSSVDSPGKDVQQKLRHKDLLLKISGQLSEEQKAQTTTELLSFIADWVKKGGEGIRDTSARRYLIDRRMFLAGLLFDPTSIISAVLFKALEQGFSAMDQGSDASCFEEELITSALRASIELKCLGLLKLDFSKNVLLRLLDTRFVPIKLHCRSACVGTLGAFAVGATCSTTQIAVVQYILETARSGFNQWNSEGLIFECLWALNIIFASPDQCLDMEWARPCATFAKQICDDPYYQQWDQDDCCTTSDCVNALREAEKLLRTLGNA